MGQNFELAVPVATQSHRGPAGLGDRIGPANPSDITSSGLDGGPIADLGDRTDPANPSDITGSGLDGGPIADLGDRTGPANTSDITGSGLDGAPMAIPSPQALHDRFLKIHESAYGYANPHDPIEIVNVRLTARGRFLEEAEPPRPEDSGPLPEPFERRAVRFAARNPVDCPVYQRSALRVGHRLEGPAIVEQLDSTTPIFPADRAAVDSAGNLVIEIRDRAGAGQ